MAYISTTFTGTPQACIEHFDKVCASYHPSGYGTRIGSIRWVPAACEATAGLFRPDVATLRTLPADQRYEITIGRYDSAD